jgi:hypothetical protein
MGWHVSGNGITLVETPVNDESITCAVTPLGGCENPATTRLSHWVGVTASEDVVGDPDSVWFLCDDHYAAYGVEPLGKG